jgi:hypothetical protein
VPSATAQGLEPDLSHVGAGDWQMIHCLHFLVTRSSSYQPNGGENGTCSGLLPSTARIVDRFKSLHFTVHPKFSQDK